MRVIVLLFFVFSITAASLQAATYRTQILFNNRTPAGDQPVKLPDETGPGEQFFAQLYQVTGAGSVVQPIGPVTQFRDVSPQARYFVEPIEITLENFPFPSATSASATIVLRLRVWRARTGIRRKSVENPKIGSKLFIR